MSSRRARAEVPGVGSVHLALHEAHDQYISEEIDALGSWEPFETEVIRRFLSPGDLIVDAGANIGWYSVVAALLGAEVLAYEPMTGNVALLEQNLGLNDVAHRVTVVRAALGDHAGQASLQLSSDNQGDHRVSATPVGDTQTIDVRTLDDELALRPTRLLKVDTQGSEARVLRGGRRSLSPDRAVGTVMILEFWAYGLADCFVRVVDAASADAAMRAASGRPPTRFVRELALSLHTHDLLRYRRTLLRNLRNRLRGVPTK